jgi:hypothetical protein
MTKKKNTQLFSQRMGLEADFKKIQLKQMDDDLKNPLWNLIHKYVLYYIEKTGLPITNQLKESFNKIYNFTNDKTVGIRHGVSGAHVAPDFETAKYVLVASSAFVNYLVGLAEKAGVIGKTKNK